MLAANPAASWGKYDNRLKIGGVKITIDGSPQGRTAFFTTPYLAGGPSGEKNWSGELDVPPGAPERVRQAASTTSACRSTCTPTATPPSTRS